MLALIAGTGALPAEIVSHLPRPPLVCALAGHEPDGLDADIVFRIETVGTLLADLASRGVTEICLAGAIRRPVIDPSRIDAATAPLVATIQRAMMAGDDGALRALLGLLEEAGLTVRAAHQIAPDLLPAPGCPTRLEPGDGDRRDAARGQEILACMGAADIGQACVVLDGQALAVESVFGTDWMLESLGARPDAGGGVLFKAPKPGQDRRADLPAIGPGTVVAAVAAGLSGIVIEAGGVIVLDRPAVIGECDRLGLFLWVRERPA